MASTLCSGLGLDNADLTNKLLVINEESGSDSSFINACLIWKGLIRSDENVHTNVCHLSFHNTQEHYENISIKLGFNVGNYIRKGSVMFIDGLKYINTYFNNSECKDANEITSNEFCKSLFLLVKEKVQSLSQNNRNNVYVLIGDVSDLLSAGFTLRSVLVFIKYCRTLLSDRGVTLCIGTYSNVDAEFYVLYRNLCSVADYCITVSGLKTGFSADVTGGINIITKTVSELGYNHYRRDWFHFKFSDRQVKIFYPGAMQ